MDWLVLRVFLFGLQHWISPHSHPVVELMRGKIWPSVVFHVLLNLWSTIRFQLDQFLYESSIFVIFIGCIHPSYNRGVAVFFHISSNNFPCFQEGHIPLLFHHKHFLFFFVNIARSCVIRMILSAVCTFNFFQAIFLYMFRVLFTAFGTCVSSSTALRQLADLHFLGSIGLIKCQDVSVSLDSFFVSSMKVWKVFIFNVFCLLSDVHLN